MISDIEINTPYSEEISDRIEETARIMMLATKTNEILNRYGLKKIDEDTTLALWDAEIEAFLERVGRYE